MLPTWQIDAQTVERFVHGTTVATNAVLERTGATLGILTTAGFTDVLEIGRQSRSQVYDLILKPETPVFLAPGERRCGVVEGIGPTGEIITPLDLRSLEVSVQSLLTQGVDAVAICFLHAHVNSEHERKAAEYLRQHYPQLTVSLSSEIDPAFREYERTIVTAFDAYVKSKLDDYLNSIDNDLKRAGVPATMQVMQSRGGVCSSKIARQRPIRMFLSGPAAGVVGAKAVGLSTGCKDIITVDIGGTSSDIALITQGETMIRPDGLLDGYRIRVPMVDVNAIGAGGGSIAWIDTGGGLRVGPRSAGAEPGPACYGRGGDQATVTDASVVLGVIDPAYFAGGTLKLNPDLAWKAIEQQVAKPLGLSVQEAALGIHRVVNAQMAEGIRLVSISRGVDPRHHALMPFGGGGAVHATPLARELNIDTIIVPRHPGVLCASGLLSAMTEHEATVSYMGTFEETDPLRILALCEDLRDECMSRMALEGVPESEVETSWYADICYVGQAHHLEVPFETDNPNALLTQLYDQFCQRHETVYGHSTRAPSRFVNLRVVLRARNPLSPQTLHEALRPTALKGTRPILLEGSDDYVAAAIYDRQGLMPGDVIQGPAVIEQSDTTTLIETGWEAKVADNEALLLTRKI